MIDFADRWSWCALQVTLFSAVAATLYLLLRRQSGLRSLLPVRCLAGIAALTLLIVAPWPAWKHLQQRPANSRLPSSVLLLVEDKLQGADPALTLDPLASQLPVEIGTQPLPTLEPQLPVTLDERQERQVPPGTWKKRFLLIAALLSLLALLRLLVAIRELTVRTRTSQLITDAAIHAELAELQSRFQSSQTVSLRETPTETMPATVGWRKPVVLLPQSWRNWSTAQLRAVLAHELAHVRSRHFSAWIAVQVPLLLHSYHPLVHWLARRVRWEQELSADRLAVDILGDRDGYLTALAELALNQTNRRGPFANFSLAPTSTMLLGRLKMLLQTDPQSNRPVSLFKRALLATALLLAGLAVSGLRGNPATAIADETLQPPESDIAAPAETTQSTGATDEVSDGDSSDTVTIHALVSISPRQSDQFFGGENAISSPDWGIHINTQLTLLRSSFVLKAAIADESIANSTFLRNQTDPLAWLTQHLSVFRMGESSILRLELHDCPKEEIDSGLKTVAAVIDAYRNEVLRRERMNAATRRDSLEALKIETWKELRDKIERYEVLARELGGKESHASSIVAQIITNRLERIDTSVERLEEEQLLHDLELEQTEGEPTTSQKTRSEFFVRRLAQLEERRAELMSELSQRSESSAELTMLKSDIEQLQIVANEMSRNLRTLDIDKQAGPAQMQILQPPTASGNNNPSSASESPSPM